MGPNGKSAIPLRDIYVRKRMRDLVTDIEHAVNDVRNIQPKLIFVNDFFPFYLHSPAFVSFAVIYIYF